MRVREKNNKLCIVIVGIVICLGCILMPQKAVVQASMVDVAEYYEVGEEYEGRIEDYPERYFEFEVAKKSYVSLLVTWKKDSEYRYDCQFAIWSDSGIEVLKSEDIKFEHNAVNGWNTGSNGRILQPGKYYLEVGTGSDGSMTESDFSFRIQIEDQIKLPKGAIQSLKKAKAGQLKVTCKTVEGALGYRIQYSTDVKFKKGVKTVYSSSTTKTISGLKKGTIYYVKVCPYSVYDDGTYVFGQNSKVKSVVTKK